MPLRIEIVAEDEAELRALVAALQPLLGQAAPAPSRVPVNDRGEAAAVMTVDLPAAGDVVEAPKNKGGRPRKVREEPASGPDLDKERETAPEQETNGKADDEDARKQAIELLRTVFARAPKGPPMIKALQQKYAVTKFVDVPVERAAELLADANKADAATSPR